MSLNYLLKPSRGSVGFVFVTEGRQTGRAGRLESILEAGGAWSG